jgi:hypothetical protein
MQIMQLFYCLSQVKIPDRPDDGGSNHLRNIGNFYQIIRRNILEDSHLDTNHDDIRSSSVTEHTTFQSIRDAVPEWADIRLVVVVRRIEHCGHRTSLPLDSHMTWKI